MQHIIDYPIPANEAERLEALRSTQLLDSKPEVAFDAIVLQARKAFNTPIVAISLLDDHRQWFKAKIGLDISQTPRNIAFCAHTIIHDEVMYVLDAMQDMRFAHNPLVTGDTHIRFYAGAPIIISKELIIGTLCVIDTEPRASFSVNDKLTLQTIADAVKDLVYTRILMQLY